MRNFSIIALMTADFRTWCFLQYFFSLLSSSSVISTCIDAFPALCLRWYSAPDIGPFSGSSAGLPIFFGTPSIVCLSLLSFAILFPSLSRFSYMKENYSAYPRCGVIRPNLYLYEHDLEGNRTYSTRVEESAVPGGGSAWSVTQRYNALVTSFDVNHQASLVLLSQCIRLPLKKAKQCRYTRCIPWQLARVSQRKVLLFASFSTFLSRTCT